MQQDLISTSREFLLDTKYPSVAATREAFRRQEGACRAFHEALGVQEGARHTHSTRAATSRRLADTFRLMGKGGEPLK